jgi:hypothetical protein
MPSCVVTILFGLNDTPEAALSGVIVFSFLQLVAVTAKKIAIMAAILLIVLFDFMIVIFIDY